LGLLSAPLSASAHEVRTVGNGQYEMVVGFLDEPAFQGEKNGLDLRVSKLSAATPAAASPEATTHEDAGVPVEGLETTLQAEVIYADQRMSLTLEPVWNEPGAYAAYFFPMAEGDYSFHIFGQIEGVAIDETFTSGPETFSPIQPREPLEFPKQTAQSGATAGLPGGVSALLGLGSLAVGVLTVRRRILG
jgi:hypothetical protein